MIEKVVSGGQTGVDRAALDVALRLGFACGGWCPRGRRAEDGVIPSRYPLRECGDRRYRVRTEKNVLDSDATLIVKLGPLGGGTALTRRLAARHGRPCLVVDLAEIDGLDRVLDWMERHAVRILNVAGPRESQRPGIGARAGDLLARVLARSAQSPAGTGRSQALRRAGGSSSNIS